MKLQAALRRLILGSIVSLSVLSVFGARTNPVPEHVVTPDYPDELIESAAEGEAVIRAAISMTGDVTEVSIVSATNPAFGESAVAAVKQWKFKPATVDGNPAPVVVNLPIRFTLRFEEKLNHAFGRRVFTTITDSVIPEKQFKGALIVKVPTVADLPKDFATKVKKDPMRVRLVVGPDGRTLNPQIVEDPREVLWIPALIAAAGMSFEPPMVDGSPVYVATEVRIPFVTEGEPPMRGDVLKAD